MYLYCKSVCKSRKKRQSRSFFKKFSYDPSAVRNYYGPLHAEDRLTCRVRKARRHGWPVTKAVQNRLQRQAKPHMTRGTCRRNFLNQVAERSGQRRETEMRVQVQNTKRVKPICEARTRPCAKMAIARNLVRVRLSSRSLHQCSLHQMLGEMVENKPMASHW